MKEDKRKQSVSEVIDSLSFAKSPGSQKQIKVEERRRQRREKYENEKVKIASDENLNK